MMIFFVFYVPRSLPNSPLGSLVSPSVPIFTPNILSAFLASCSLYHYYSRLIVFCMLSSSSLPSLCTFVPSYLHVFVVFVVFRSLRFEACILVFLGSPREVLSYSVAATPTLSLVRFSKGSPHSRYMDTVFSDRAYLFCYALRLWLGPLSPFILNA